MGGLRFALALGVLFGHTPDGIFTKLNSGNICVSAFYLISGLYCQLILDRYYEKWKPFVLSRFTRIYPQYFTVTILSIVFYITAGELPQYIIETNARPHLIEYSLEYASLTSKICIVFSNAFIFLQAVMRTMYVNLDGGGMSFVIPSTTDDAPLLYASINGQSWSLDIELLFYLSAPFLLRLRTPIVMAITTLTFIVRFFLGDIGWTSNIFFPIEMGVFLVGALIFRYFGGKVPMAGLSNPRIAYFSYALIIAATVGYMIEFDTILSVIGPALGRWGFILLVALCLPVAFPAGNAIAWDKALGELSYGVYMWHFLVLGCLANIGFPERYLSIATALASTAMAALALRVIDTPLDRWRHRQFRMRQSEDGEIPPYRPTSRG